jgi:hypothetical protein
MNCLLCQQACMYKYVLFLSFVAWHVVHSTRLLNFSKPKVNTNSAQPYLGLAQVKNEGLLPALGPPLRARCLPDRQTRKSTERANRNAARGGKNAPLPPDPSRLLTSSNTTPLYILKILV